MVSGCAAWRPANLPRAGSQVSAPATDPSSWPSTAPGAPSWESTFRDLAPAEPFTARRHTAPSPAEFRIDHPRVEDFLGRFQTRSRGFFQDALERSGKYLPRMTAILEKEGVPAELVYLPIIESGFKTSAVSRAGAVGPWQFIRGTGRRYGLRIDQYVDERRDPVKSTRAAARYLRDLYGMFGDWHLSLAAYNTGEFKITRIQDKRGPLTFWEMRDRGYLHRETSDYVPQFLAALQIARAPEAHGFVESASEPLRYEVVQVNRSLSFQRLAQMAAVPVSEIAELNPALVRKVTPPDRDGYQVRIPVGTKERFAVAYANLLREQARPAPKRGATRAAQAVDRVRAGDTPASIAKRLGVGVRELMRVNGWKNPRALRPGQPVRVPPKKVPMRVAGAAKRGVAN
jgi:membrane-bound lytic murein transglycosylase D